MKSRMNPLLLINHMIGTAMTEQIISSDKPTKNQVSRNGTFRTSFSSKAMIKEKTAGHTEADKIRGLFQINSNEIKV